MPLATLTPEQLQACRNAALALLLEETANATGGQTARAYASIRANDAREALKRLCQTTASQGAAAMSVSVFMRLATESCWEELHTGLNDLIGHDDALYQKYLNELAQELSAAAEAPPQPQGFRTNFN